MPFHSTFLRSRGSALLQFVKRENVDPKQLIGKYIPNLTGMPFEISRAYLEEVWILTGSEEISRILGRVSRLLEKSQVFQNQLTLLNDSEARHGQYQIVGI